MSNMSNLHIDLVNHLEAVGKTLKNYIEEIGGCDHSVGICICSLIREAEENTRLLNLLGGPHG